MLCAVARLVFASRHASGAVTVWVDDMKRPSFVCPFSLNKLSLSDGRAYVGFTAATGGRFQKHDIEYLKFEVGTCPNDCNLQGQCIEGECQCEGLYVILASSPLQPR